MELENTKDITVVSTAISRTDIPSSVTNGRLAHEILVRPSDTDRRKIVNSARIGQFFEDALLSHGKVPDMFYYEILGQLRAKTRCDIFSAVPHDKAGSEMVSFLVERDTGKTIARSFVSWNSKVLENS